MKKFTACALSVCMVAATLVGCNGNNPASPAPTAGPDGGEVDPGSTAPSGDKELIVYAFTEEVPGMVQRYLNEHPESGYTMTKVVKSEAEYQTPLDMALGDAKTSPDIYCAEAAYILKYTQGDMYQYALPYKDLGIDIDASIKAADIAAYTVDIGTNPNGDVVGLGYQATGGAFIYRRSIAKDVWGDDAPETVAEKIGAGSGNWDKFWVAAEDLKAKGYAIVSGQGDIWHAIENSSDQGWVVDGKLVIDPKREEFLDVAKKLCDNGYYNDTTDWNEAWFNDMKMDGTAFGFFGPAWLLNYSLAENCKAEDGSNSSFGDWGVCESPIGFFWGGTWVLASKYVPERGNADIVKDIITWITLDTSETGLQYLWANGTYNPEKGTKDAVASGVIMANANGEVDILSGQNMFDVFVPANTFASGKTATQYDSTINDKWKEQVSLYAHGEKDRDAAIEDFKTAVTEVLDVTVD